MRPLRRSSGPLTIFLVLATVALAEPGVLFEGSKYSTGRIRIAPDDLLVLFSDGLADRGSPSGELFGADRLRETAARAYGEPVRIALYTLLGEVQGWAGGRPAEDDQTLILARVR